MSCSIPVPYKAFDSPPNSSSRTITIEQNMYTFCVPSIVNRIYYRLVYSKFSFHSGSVIHRLCVEHFIWQLSFLGNPTNPSCANNRTKTRQVMTFQNTTFNGSLGKKCWSANIISIILTAGPEEEAA